ncbi:MAG: SMP-30/gluconolactonase/LRE family protein [Halioglobus sp.]|nr:SMP-30/gluconolactonase/LRE family protein [Halioglobus sp.]
MSGLTCVWDGKAELGEGVFWHGQEQAVFWVDIILSNLHRLGADGATNSWHFPGQISAVVPCESGGFLATFENGLSHLDLETSTATQLVVLENELPNNRFNDGYSDTRGQFWFGSMDNNQRDVSGSFYCMDRNGDVEQVISFGKVCITNGPTFSTDGHWTFFTDSVKKKVYRAPLSNEGKAGVPELYLEFGEQDGFPDGMCTDTEGGLWICHFAGSRVTRFSEGGKIDQVIEMPVPNITKCAFGGPNLQTLYIITAATALDEVQRKEYPESGGLFAIDLDYQGVASMTVARPRVTL